MTLTRHRMPQTFSHESWCCGIHDIDIKAPSECVALEWMLQATSTRTVLIDGTVASSVPFYNEAQRYIQPDTTKWIHLVDLDEDLDEYGKN